LLVLTSLALGLLVLAAVPLHAAVRADPDVLAHDDYLDPACRTPAPIAPEPVCPRVVAGESPATIVYALVVVPLVVRRGGRLAMKVLAAASAGFAVLQLVAPFVFTFPPIEAASGTPPPFEAHQGCGLVNCGLDHTLFHLVQVPFFVALGLMSLRRAWSRPRSAPDEGSRDD
jgi:hypothetical protein